MERMPLSSETIHYPTINRQTHFILCQSCFWCASSYNMVSFSITSITKCPCCGNNKIELMPISDNEVYRVDYNPKTGIILEF